MARRALSPAQLAVGRAVAAALADVRGPVVVGVSGGADSLALAAGTAWATRSPSERSSGSPSERSSGSPSERSSGSPSERQRVEGPRAIVVDHGLQPGSDAVAQRAAAQCRGLGLAAEVVRVVVDAAANVEARARGARLAALAAPGLPVLLGHTLDDQAETVLLGLARGSGTRSLAGMAPRRGPFLRPLLGLRRDLVAQACADWGLQPWHDPHNDDLGYARVRVRDRLLPVLEGELGPGIAAALARTARLARADADCLDALADGHPLADELAVAGLEGLPDALRTRILHRWLRRLGSPAHAAHVDAIDSLVMRWRGQGPVDVGVRILRSDGRLRRA